MTQPTPWHEDDAFWDTWGEVMFSSRSMSAAPKQVDEILALIKLTPNTHILDLCCGVGRHSLEFARRGFRVTGVDRTRSYLDRAGAAAKKEGLKIELVHDDMRTFCRPEAFNAIVNLSTSFAYSDDPQEDRVALGNVLRSLRSEGVFVLETAGKEVLARVFLARDWQEQDGIFFLQERKVTHDWTRMENRWIMFKDNRRYERLVTHRIFAASELASLFRECGFAEVKVFGGFDGSPYDNTARRLVAIARKGST